jgi:ribose 1,5-bisphosphokinase
MSVAERVSDVTTTADETEAAKIGPGVFVAVAGPSGAGKDTIINYAREKLAGRAEFVFARRVITRAADANSEDHDSLTPDAFAAAERDGAFSLVWEAHDLRYGLPASIDMEIGRGRVVIANISRQIIPALDARYEHFGLVAISAHRDVIAKRLAARGRESEEAIAKRLGRVAKEDLIRADAIHIENSGPKENAGERFVAMLEAAVVTAAEG